MVGPGPVECGAAKFRFVVVWGSDKVVGCCFYFYLCPQCSATSRQVGGGERGEGGGCCKGSIVWALLLLLQLEVCLPPQSVSLPAL